MRAKPKLVEENVPAFNQSDLDQNGKSDTFLPILTTKLYRPPVPLDVVPRPSLLDRLVRNRRRQLTLISALAGYGKSTLASMWLQAGDSANAWVSLDEHDNDLIVFITYVVAAVSGAFPTAQLKTWELLDAPVLPSVQVLARFLLADLEQIGERLILALDDIHLVRNQAVFDLLIELLRHPSHALHLVLIGRRDPPLPIPSLRAGRQITEIRARDLRFSVTETAALLSNMLQRDVGEAIAAAWTNRTEGWVTALHLAALSLRHRGQLSALSADVQGDSRYLQEYLLAEVLTDMPPARKSCLSRISILDRFCAPLCDALCQTDINKHGGETTGHEIIQWLWASNLFLIPLDDQHKWFRFHHLFQHHLQQSLSEHFEPAEIAALHVRASTWLEENGLWDEALQHLMAAGDVSAAVQFIVRHRYKLMNTQQWPRLYRWLQLLPPDIVTQSPYLISAISFLSTHMHSGLFSQIADVFQHAEHVLTTLPRESEEYRVVQAEIAANQGVLAAVAGDTERAMVKAQQCLEILPDQAVLIRMLANTVIATCLQMRGQYRLGVDLMNTLLRGTKLPSPVHGQMLHNFCVIRFMEGDLKGVLASALDGIRLHGDSMSQWLLSYQRQHLGVAHYLRNEFEEAEPYLRALVADGATSAPSYLAFGTLALALIHISRSQWAEADRLVELASNFFNEVNDGFAIAVAKAFRVELAFRRGELGAAQRLGADCDFDMRPPMWFFYVPQLTPLKLLWAEGTPPSLAKARSALEALDERMAAIHRKNVRIDVLSLLALVCDAQGDRTVACEKVKEALSLAEPGGFIRNFVDLGPPMADLLTRLTRQNHDSQLPSLPYITQILDAFPATDLAKPKIKSAPRTAILAGGFPGRAPLQHERQILRLLATDLSPEEIARSTGVSVATVRTHIRNIYGKLDVHSRFEAVHHAEGLDLI